MVWQAWTDTKNSASAWCFRNIVRGILMAIATLHAVQVTAQEFPSEFQWGFEDRETRWSAPEKPCAERIASHFLTDIDQHGGKQSEFVRFQSAQFLEGQRLILPVSPSRVTEELQATVWVRASCPDVRMVLQLRFPHQIDPRTGQQLVLDLPGDRYTERTQWQALTCRTTEAAIRQRIQLAHAQFNALGNPIEIDDREVYVDQIALIISIPEGATDLLIDDVSYGPIVRPSQLLVQPENDVPRRQRLRIVDDRILKDDQPFFPIFTLYHGEGLNDIQLTGVNTLWIPDYTDRALLTALHEMEIGAIAQPPQLSPEDAIFNQQGLPQFGAWTEPIWAWMLGFSIPTTDVRYIESWGEKVRNADRQMRRPIMADVAGNERAFHRKVELLGTSRLAIHTEVDDRRNAALLKHHRNLALPGKPMFTFVQTESSPVIFGDRDPDEALPIVEPEQILHQGYAAIASGFKGVGFWKQIPLDDERAGLNERAPAIRLFAMHCNILQPWLATGRVIHDDLPVQLDANSGPAASGVIGTLSSKWDTPIQQAGATVRPPQPDIRATVLAGSDGWLILPVWYEQGGQCVPGPQTASGVRMLLNRDIWQAWEVTPVSVTQSNIEVSWPAGGTEICLKEFDQHSAIVITDNPEVIERLQREVLRVRDQSAKAMVSLAGLKFERVQKVHQELVELDVAIPQAELTLRQSYTWLELATKELSAGRSVDAYAAARKSLQYLRRLQRRYWDAAMQEMPSVVTSLDASSFQTLPAHWKLLEDLGGRPRVSPNLIPSGSFEDGDELRHHWLPEHSERGRKQLLRQHDSLRNDHHLSLSLESLPGEGAVNVLTSPEVSAFAGDLVVITAQVRTLSAFSRPDAEFLIFDSYTGPDGAVRIQEYTPGWQTIKIVRRITRDVDFRVRFELRGEGHVDVDDLRVHRLLR